MNSSRVKNKQLPLPPLLNVERVALGLVFSWVMCGLVAVTAGWLGWLWPFFSLVMIGPVTFLALWLIVSVFNFPKLQRIEKILVWCLGGVWILHLVGVFLPEIGFDAVWYHFPIVKAFSEAHRIYYLPEYYQSLNPLFSDMIFLLGFQVGGETGAKVVAYALAVSLVIVVYQLARQFMSRFWALWCVLLISTFQVVAWQASSFYVDVAKALWEISSVWLLVREVSSYSARTYWQTAMAGVLFGASLATKLFSLLLWPTFLILTYLSSRQHIIRRSFIFISAALMVVLPFYVYTFVHSYNPFLSVSLHVSQLEPIGGTDTLGNFIVNRTVFLPLWWWYMLTARDYTSFLLLLFTPLLVWKWRLVWQNLQLRMLAVFVGSQLFIWWYVPPLSTRYALAGFIVWAILTFHVIEKYCHYSSTKTRLILFTLLLGIVFNLLPRFVVLNRNVSYVVGSESKEQYLSRFYDGLIDEPLKKWHDSKR